MTSFFISQGKNCRWGKYVHHVDHAHQSDSKEQYYMLAKFEINSCIFSVRTCCTLWVDLFTPLQQDLYETGKKIFSFEMSACKHNHLSANYIRSFCHFSFSSTTNSESTSHNMHTYNKLDDIFLKFRFLENTNGSWFELIHQNLRAAFILFNSNKFQKSS